MSILLFICDTIYTITGGHVGSRSESESNQIRQLKNNERLPAAIISPCSSRPLLRSGTPAQQFLNV